MSMAPRHDPIAWIGKWTAAALAAALWLVPHHAYGAQRSSRSFKLTDGLPSDYVQQLLVDSSGYLWVATTEGLARFDGREISTFANKDGLPSASIAALLEVGEGELFIATGQGLFRYRAERSPAFEALPLEPPSAQAPVDQLVLAHDGSVWAAGPDGLHHLHRDGAVWRSEPFALPPALEPIRPFSFTAALVDHSDAIVLVQRDHLLRIDPERHVSRFDQEGDLLLGTHSIVEAPDRTLWLATHRGLCRLNDLDRSATPLCARRLTTADGLPADRTEQILFAQDGTIWVATGYGLAQMTLESNGRARFERLGAHDGIGDDLTTALAEDSGGGLWIGTESAGVTHLIGAGLTSFDSRDGMSSIRVAQVMEDGGGLLVATTSDGPLFQRFDGQRFAPFSPSLPASFRAQSWGWSQLYLHDHLGEWWIPSAAGVCHFPAADRLEQLRGRAPLACYGAADGLGTGLVFRSFEDSRGDIWLSCGLAENGSYGVARWRRADRTIRRWAVPTVISFAEDRGGEVWAGGSNGNLYRWRGESVDTIEGASAGKDAWVLALLVDHAGMLWAGSSGGGLGRCADPTTESPRFEWWTRERGLSSDGVRTLVEGRDETLYVGTRRGVDRIAPDRRQITHLTTAEGLPANRIDEAFRTSDGTIWFGTARGLARLRPRAVRPDRPARVLIASLEIAGERSPIDATRGRAGAIELSPDQRNLTIHFLAPSVGLTAEPLYQTRLIGAGLDWNAPSSSRFVTYASLAPGVYRFEARAVGPSGPLATTPAAVEFELLAPFWRRGWFWGAVFVVVTTALLLVARARIRQQFALERIRTRIATDLHDDLGSSLAQIALVSESARQELPAESDSAGAFERVAAISRELSTALSDIVWSVNPRWDRFADLARRSRRFADDLSDLHGIKLEFQSSAQDESFRLDPDLRRDAFLILKEAAHNAVKHSRCSKLSIKLDCNAVRLLLSVQDDGVGFDTSSAFEGNGLLNMRRRAGERSATISIGSRAGEGTKIEVSMPLGRGARRRFFEETVS